MTPLGQSSRRVRAARTTGAGCKAAFFPRFSSSVKYFLLTSPFIEPDGGRGSKDVIVDNTHFSPIHEWRYRDLAKEHGYSFEIVRFTDVPIEECIRRDVGRRNWVGETVIRSMEEYRMSLRREVVAFLKKQWTAKKARAAKKAATDNRKKAAAG